MFHKFIPSCICFFFSQNPLVNQFIFIQCVNIIPCSYFFLHEWLCKVWVINFIMSESSLANQINHNIFSKRVSLVNSRSKSIFNFDWFLCIDMYDRTICSPAQIGRVESMSIIRWIGGKANLVISDHMNRPTSSKV